LLQVRINGDTAALKGIMKEMLAEEERRPGQVLDHEFIRRYTGGFDEFIADLGRTSWDEIVKESGVPLEHLRAAGQMVARAKRMICCWAMGLTSTKMGLVPSRRSSICCCSVSHREAWRRRVLRTWHSNVQGDRTMEFGSGPHGSSWTPWSTSST